MGGSFQWPSVGDVLEYRQQVRQTILQLLDTVEIQLPITQDSPLVRNQGLKPCPKGNTHGCSYLMSQQTLIILHNLSLFLVCLGVSTWCPAPVVTPSSIASATSILYQYLCIMCGVV